MNIITTVFVLLLVFVGLAALIPILSLGFALLVAAAIFFIWCLPIIFIAASEVTSGGEKLLWILAIVFLSWFAWILYFFLAPIKPKDRYSY
jgi:hypothetical protein